MHYEKQKTDGAWYGCCYDGKSGGLWWFFKLIDDYSSCYDGSSYNCSSDGSGYDSGSSGDNCSSG